MERKDNAVLGVQQRLTRRQILAGGAQATGLLAFGGIIAACGGGGGAATTAAPPTTAAATTQAAGGSTATETTPQLSGTITMMNYPGWMGKNEVANFEKAYPGVKVKQVEGLTSGVAAAVTQVQQNKDSYDMTLGALGTAGALDAAGLLEPVDLANIPNIKNIAPSIQQAYPFGIPTDYGHFGYGYRKDLISERPTSWADVWKLAPKYSKKIVIVDFDNDVISATMLYLGYDVNSTDPKQLEEAKNALIKLKPDVQAFLATDVIKPMLQGSAVLTVDYDYDIAIAAKKNPNVVWVAPDEGTPAYLDGWAAIKGTSLLPEVEAFMNFQLDPKIYADFINTTGAAYIMPAAEPYIDKSITSNPALKYDETAINGIKWEKYLGPEAVKARGEAWAEVKAA